MNIPVSDLAFYDPARNDWYAEEGTFQIFVSFSAGDIRKALEITVN